MTLPRIIAWISPEHFPDFKVILRDDPDFPSTHDAWLKESNDAIEKLAAHGTVTNKQRVDPEEFANWCRNSGVDATYDMLRGFAVRVKNKV